MKAVAGFRSALVLLIAAVALGGCAGGLFHRGAGGGPRVFGDQFRHFMEAAKGLDENGAWAQWRGIMEASDPDFFREAVGGEGEDPEWETSYRSAFRKAWPLLVKHQPGIEAEFARFPVLFEENLEAFRKSFPDFDLHGVPVYAAPSLLRFNGRGTEAGGPKVLAFGIDTIVLLREEPRLAPGMGTPSHPNVLYAQELFHVHHVRAQGIESGPSENELELANDAWNEGLATYVSGALDPAAADEDLLMDPMLARACKAQGRELVRRFKAVAHVRRSSARGRALYRDWFQLASRDSSLPPRAGTCVGLLLVRRLVKAGFSVQQMAGWHYREVPYRLDQFLY